jgi:hypothetical protein
MASTMIFENSKNPIKEGIVKEKKIEVLRD